MVSTRAKGCMWISAAGCLLALVTGGGLIYVGAWAISELNERHLQGDRIREILELPEIEISTPKARVSEEDQRAFEEALALGSDAALDELDRLIEKYPNCYNLHYERASIARARGELDDALAHYEVGISMRRDRGGSYFPFDDKDVPVPPFVALLEKADVLEAMGRVDEAIDVARSSLEADPDHGYQPLVYIGNLQCDLGRFEEALPNFERALLRDEEWTFDDGRRHALAGRARAKLGLGRNDEALEDYLEASAVDWRDVDAELHLEMALIQEERGDLEGAQRSLDHARALLPESPEPAAEPERRIRDF